MAGASSNVAALGLLLDRTRLDGEMLVDRCTFVVCIGQRLNEDVPILFVVGNVATMLR